MSKPKLFFVTILALTALALALVWQQRALQALRAENAALRVNNAQAEAQGADSTSQAQSQTESEATELQRLRASQPELLRLRSEVARLRQQLGEKQAPTANHPAPGALSAPVAEDQSGSPVQLFGATTRASVTWQQTLITGGWKMPSGKRALIFVQPQAIPGTQPAQITFQTRVIELPEQVLVQIGLDALQTDSKQSAAQAILSSQQTETTLRTLETASGVEILSAPAITTVDHRQAQVSVTNEKSFAGQTYSLGPAVDIVPEISQGGASVDLTIVARLTVPSTPSQ